MNYCPQCGNTLTDGDKYCSKCGYDIQLNVVKPSGLNKEKTIIAIIKAFMIIGCVSLGWMLIPLAWCVPMTVSYFHKVERGEPISTGFKICTLLFVNVIAGILLLCADDI